MEALIHLVTNVLALLLADWIVPGFKAKGLWGVLLAAVAIGVAGWLLMRLLNLLAPGLLAWCEAQQSWQSTPPSDAPATPASPGGALQLSIDWANRPFTSVTIFAL